MKKSNKKIWIALLVLVLIAALLLGLYYGRKRAQVSQGAKFVTINVDHLEGEDTTFTIHTDEEFLRGALDALKLVEEQDSDYGLWVQTVDGETADDSKQQWWGFDVNGQFAEYGVDSQPIADGDVIDFKLNVGY